ncbi:MAG TPA: hypothetical protein DGT21_15385 [Armatimonadetes bacterium]|nr:hypothetical protein [Armatimonadota bacterium]
MSAIPFLDCNCMIGIRAKPEPCSIYKLEDFKRDFEYYDIMAAVVYHAVAHEYSCDYGNRRLMREIGDDPQLVPQWVLLPHHTNEMPPAPELVAEMLSLGVRCARILPKTHGFGTSEYVVGPLLGELERARIPLFIDQGELSLEEAVTLCRRHPLLPVVLCGTSWASDRVLYPALALAPNLHIETWAHQGHRAYERFVREFGSDRLLFGTDLPNRSPGAARMMCNYEQISDEDRRKIAGGSMLRLLSNVRGAQGRPLPELADPPAHPDDDPIVACVRAGKPLSEWFILDAHGHISHPGAMGVRIALPYNDGDHLVETMDRVGIDLCVVSTWSGITEGDPESNDIALDAVGKHPGRLLAYGCNNPNYPEQYRAEFERIFLTDRVVGYKPYPSQQGIRIDAPEHELILRWADEQEKPVLCHGSMSPAGGMSPDMAKDLGKKYPNAKFLVAHTGSSWPFAQGIAAAAKECPNVFAEITYTAILYGFIEYFCEEVGAEQLLFGTDCVMRDVAPQLGWVAWARIPFEDKLKVLAQNMADILKMPVEQRVSRT